MDKLKTILSNIKMPKVKIPKVKISMPKINIKPILDKSLVALKRAANISVKAIKGFLSWLGKAIKESIAQVWTLLGFFIAWLTLTGTAQQIVGIATLAATVLWLITIPLREEKE